jgi:putative chitinase
MPYDRNAYFDSVRPLFGGQLTQRQVDGQNYLLDVWEAHFDQSREWLAYALATVFHETAQTMVPLEEYGRGSGKSYGQPVGPYEQVYYGRGHVQLTWEANYMNGETFLKQRYGIDVPMHRYPGRMLEDEPSALVLYDGMIHGWFTGVGLPQYFNATLEDPRNARKIVNGLDQADLIASYYWTFKAALLPQPAAIA